MGTTELIEVERILAHRTPKRGAISYLVLWKGFGIKDATWEPEAHLEGCDQVLSEYYRNPRPNVTKTQILQEAKQRRDKVEAVPATPNEWTAYSASAEPAESIERRSTPTTSEMNKTFDVLDTPNTRRTFSSHNQVKEEPPFDWRAFLKLGCTASAIVVIAFLIFSGSDNYYIRKYAEHHMSAGSQAANNR